MSLTADALWLNTVFAGYDMAILSFLHKLAESAGAVLTPLFKLITLLGEKGILFFLLGIVLMLFPALEANRPLHLRRRVLRSSDYQHSTQGRHCTPKAV